MTAPFFFAKFPNRGNYEDSVVLPSGQSLGQYSTSLIHWLPNPLANEVNEVVHVISKRRTTREVCADTKKMRLKIDGSNLKIFENEKLIGFGVLAADGWDWKSLSFEVRSQGHKVIGLDNFDGPEWTSQKQIFDHKGDISIVVAAVLRPISETTFNLLSPKGLPSCVETPTQ